MGTNISVKTAQAAEIAGVGYEGFRSWLKRGLLKSTGTLPKFYASSAPAEEPDAKRWRWSAFGFSDLCSFRLAKLMLDAGLDWNMVCTIASDETLWRSHRADAGMRYVAAFPKSDQYTFYTLDSLTADLATETVKYDWMTLFDLHEIRRSVEFRSRAVSLRTIANYLTKNSHISSWSGPNLPSPDEKLAQQSAIKRLIEDLEALAHEAEDGGGSYQKFEAILFKLQGLGAFPENADVSAVAFAFVD
jgi:hypothetical protein